MPQMMIETFVSQYFWLMVFFFVLNFYMTTTGIPSIPRTLKIRKKASFKGDSDAVKGDSIDLNLSLPSTVSEKETITSFNKARQSWLQKNS